LPSTATPQWPGPRSATGNPLRQEYRDLWNRPPSGSLTGSSRPCSLRSRESSHPCDFALVAMLGVLGLRLFEATGADIADLGEEHGHRVLRVCGKGTKVVLVPLPPAIGRAIDRAIGSRTGGPILLTSRGARMDRHAATRRLRHIAEAAGVPITRPHPHMPRHTFVTTLLDAGVDLRDVQIAARHADPRTTMRYDRARKNLDRHPNYILAAYMASGT